MRTTNRPGVGPRSVAALLAVGVAARAMMTVAAATVLAQGQAPLEAAASRPPEDVAYVVAFAGVLGIAAMAFALGLRVQVVNVTMGGLIVGAGMGWLAWTFVPVGILTVGAPLAAVMAIVGFFAGGQKPVRKFLRGNARPHGWIMDTPGRDRDPEGWPKRPHDLGPD